MKFTAYREAAIDYDGTEIKEYKKEFDSPFIPTLFGPSRHCYVIYKGFFGKYKIRECIVCEIWFTNIWGLAHG